MFVSVRLENKDGNHNKFYEMTLTKLPHNVPSKGTIRNPVQIEIHSGRIGSSNVLQEPKDTVDGWSTWEEGYRWFTKQLKSKVGRLKEYQLRTAKASKGDERLVSDVERIAYEFASDAKRTEEAMEYIESRWW